MTPKLWNFQRVLHTLAATREVPRHTRLHSKGSTRVPPTSRGAPFPSPSSRVGILSLRGRERIPDVSDASQEEARCTGKARGTHGSCHHSKSSPDVSVHSRGTCFPCTASIFMPRINSHHGGTWDSPLGKPRGKASRKSHRSLDPRDGRRDTAATGREESTRACPHTRRGMAPLWRLQKYHKIHVSTGEESSGYGQNSTQGLRLRYRRKRNPEKPPSNSMGTGLSTGHQSLSMGSSS